MPNLDLVHWALAAAIAGVLVWAAAIDVIRREIPNVAVLALISLFGLWGLAGAPAGLGSGLAAGLIGFVVGFGLYVFKIMGAGDVKLFSATALFIGLTHLPMFAVATALFGGAIAVVTLVARPRRAMVMMTLRGVGDYGRGIPYGLPISLGGLLTLWAVAGGVTFADLAHVGL